MNTKNRTQLGGSIHHGQTRHLWVDLKYSIDGTPKNIALYREVQGNSYFLIFSQKTWKAIKKKNQRKDKSQPFPWHLTLWSSEGFSEG